MSVATRAKQPLKSWKNQQKKGENIQMEIEYLHTKSMIADYLTKPLIGELFYKLRDLLLGYTTLWGVCAIYVYMGPLCPITYYKKWNLLSTRNDCKYQIPSYLSSRLIEIDQEWLFWIFWITDRSRLNRILIISCPPNLVITPGFKC